LSGQGLTYTALRKSRFALQSDLRHRGLMGLRDGDGAGVGSGPALRLSARATAIFVSSAPATKYRFRRRYVCLRPTYLCHAWWLV